MELREKFGFGCMRFPMKGKEVDLEQVNQMVDDLLKRVSIILIRHMVIWMVQVKQH